MIIQETNNETAPKITNPMSVRRDISAKIATS
jgi:hypothetical protein